MLLATVVFLTICHEGLNILVSGMLIRRDGRTNSNSVQEMVGEFGLSPKVRKHMNPYFSKQRSSSSELKQSFGKAPRIVLDGGWSILRKCPARDEFASFTHSTASGNERGAGSAG